MVIVSFVKEAHSTETFSPPIQYFPFFFYSLASPLSLTLSVCKGAEEILVNMP